MHKDQTGRVLWVVATPIGNLEDLSPRARRILSEVDWIAAEDTRHTLKLLTSHGIEKPLHSLHEHSTENRVEKLVGLLSSGATGAYVSDAGTPGISDPGSALVREAVRAGIAVSPVPGPSAPVALLSVSGFQETAFLFHGFFPRESKERLAWIGGVKKLGGLHVFFDSPQRIHGSLEFLEQHSPHAEVCLGRELTKKFEEILRGTPAEVRRSLTEERGEFVVALRFPPPAAIVADSPPVDAAAVLTAAANAGAGHKVLTAIGKALGLTKNEAYEQGLKILGKSDK